MNDTERSSSPNESRFEKWLIKKLHRVACPATLELSEYAGGMLSGTELMQVKTHLEACPKCRQELMFLTTFMDEEIAPEVKKSQLDSQLASIRRLIAILQQPVDFGFGGQMAIGGMRLRGTVGDQLIYQVDDVQIVIDIQRDPEDQNLFVAHGLALGWENEDVIQVNLSQIDSIVASTVVDDIGNFSFDSLQKGDYGLLLQSQVLEIVIQELRIE